MISTTLQSQLDDFKPTSAASVTVVVKFEKGKLMDSLSSLLLKEFHRMTPQASYAPVNSLEEKDLLGYLSTLMWMRVAHVSNGKDKTYAAYRPYYTQLAVPVLFYQVITSTGLAYDADFNLQFAPAFNITGELLLSPERMLEISNLFRQYEDRGMKIVFGLPRDPNGELDFMAMAHVAEQVVSYRHAHPVYGFLAAFLAQQQLNEITGQMSRIVYGYDTDYKIRLYGLLCAINKSNV